ncbi:MAG: hypothetical protein AB7V16_09760 [Vulcanibacillus sp.]
MISDYNNKTTKLSQSVMDRILEENKWVKPVHEQKINTSKYFKVTSSIILILILLGITVSFIFINPTSNNYEIVSTNENVLSTVKPTDYAKIFSNLEYFVVNNSMISQIGEPNIYIPKQKEKDDIQLFWMLSIFSISIITLFLNWITRSDNNSDHT